MQGKRRENNTHEKDLLPGEYAYQTWIKPHGWFIRDPSGDIGTIHLRKNGGNHDIEEHEDGTITVTPSILNNHGNKWHGYLRKGIWIEA